MLQRVLVELDVFLDTRIATIAGLNDADGVELLSKTYRSRLHDDLGELTKHVTTQQFQEAYAQRDKYVLARARATPMVFLYGKIIRDHLTELLTSPKFEAVEVDVNIWPYELDEHERDMIVQCVRAYGDVAVPVRIVSIPIKDLTLKRIASEKWTGVFMYNFRTWCENHVEKIDETDPKLPSVVLVAPELYKDKNMPSVEDMRVSETESMTPFQEMRFLMSPYLSLRFVPAEYMSIMELPEDLMQEKGAPP